MLQDTSNTLSEVRTVHFCRDVKWHLVARTLVRPTDSHRTDILCGSVGGRSDARVTSPDINGPQP